MNNRKKCKIITDVYNYYNKIMELPLKRLDLRNRNWIYYNVNVYIAHICLIYIQIYFDTLYFYRDCC